MISSESCQSELVEDGMIREEPAFDKLRLTALD
jgi:hypothetical protein